MPSLDSAVTLLQLFADPTRVRLMALLSQHDLSVAELTSVTELSQSRVSTHLGRLRDAGLLRDRRVGTFTFYSINEGAMPAPAKRVWALVQDQVRDAVLDADRARCDAAVRAREKSWPDAVAGQMERYYSPGRTWEATARGFLGLMRLGDVLDGGSGDGTIAELLAPRAHTVTCLDQSAKMIDAATARLAGVANARCCVGDLHEMPFDAESFHQVLLFNTLTVVRHPGRVLDEAARVLRPGGELVAVTLDAHDHEDITSAYHHEHPGFRPAELRKMLTARGYFVDTCEVTSRERRAPYFQIVSVFARRP